MPRATHLTKGEAGIRIQVRPTPKPPCVCLGQIPDGYTFSISLLYLKAN